MYIFVTSLEKPPPPYLLHIFYICKYKRIIIGAGLIFNDILILIQRPFYYTLSATCKVSRFILGPEIHIAKNVANSCIIGQFCTARSIAFKGMVKAGKYN